MPGGTGAVEAATERATERLLTALLAKSTKLGEMTHTTTEDLEGARRAVAKLQAVMRVQVPIRNHGVEERHNKRIAVDLCRKPHR